jgi:hypothetical protein
MKTKKLKLMLKPFHILKVCYRLIKVVLTDFESALIGALKVVFPNIRHKGCYFHLSQAIWRKIQFLGFMGL